MSAVRSWVIDATLVSATFLIAIVVGAGLVVEIPRPVFIAATVGLVLVAVGTVAARLITGPDHLKARQSHLILEIADRSLAYLRRGLDEETAQEVCRLALAESEAAAVAITDTERVLGFAGIGEDHHAPGGPILTRATREAIETNEYRILASKDEIGCPREGCLLRAAIVVPLEMRGEAVGSLKFYYTTPRLLNETQATMVRGLAQLLSTQLELSELERQTELACRMELKALQAQINPHFLFNTINTIAMLIRTDPATARDLLREFPQIAVHNLHHNAVTVAELAIALLLAAAKSIVPLDRGLRARDWTPRYQASSALMLAGRTALVLGYGAVGREVARLCRSLGMEVVAVRRKGPTEPSEGPDEVYPITELERLLPRADAAVVPRRGHGDRARPRSAWRTPTATTRSSWAIPTPAPTAPTALSRPGWAPPIWSWASSKGSALFAIR